MSMTDEMRRSNIGVNTKSSVWCPCQRVEDLSCRRPRPLQRLKRLRPSIRRVLPTETGAQDMGNPTDDPPVVMSAGAGVDPGKKQRNRRPGFVIEQILIRHIHSVRPVNLAGLNQKILAIPQWLIGFGA